MIRLNDDERVELLREAERKVLEAADTVEECLHMAGLGNRFDDLADELRSLASSNGEDSIENAAKELEYRSEALDSHEIERGIGYPVDCRFP